MKFTRTHTETAFITKAGHIALEKFLHLQNRLFNAALEERIDCYRKTGKTLTAYDQFKSLTIVRKEFPEFAAYGLGAMRSCLFRLQRAFENFWCRCKEKAKKKGFPMFKTKHRGIKSFEVPAGAFSIRERGKRWAVHVKGFSPFVVNTIPDGKIKCIRIVNSARRVKVQFVMEEDCEVEKCTKPFQGIDLGISSLAVFDSGKKIAGRKRKLEKVKSRQSHLNYRTRKRDEDREDRKRKTFRSKTYLKEQDALQKENQRVKEKEKGFLHEVTTAIVKDNPNIAVEKLQILNMVKNKRLSRSILEQSWGSFVRMLEYKAERAGGRVVKVNPKNTSRMCSGCRSVKEELSLSERVYMCSNCGIEIDRDHNAAKNIANLANAGLSAGDSAGAFGNGILTSINLIRRGAGVRVQKDLFEFSHRETGI